MKRLTFFLIFIFLFFNFPIAFNSSFAESKIIYAKVENDVYFYKNPIKNESNKLFQIPNSYFVQLLENENELFYHAKYSDIDGYILKDSVIPINEIPNYPYANTTFRVFAPTKIYSSPSSDSEITDISSLTEITNYYGNITGVELLPQSTDLWYYCKYKSNENFVYGYIFSYYCDQFKDIILNTENYTPITEEIFTSKENIVLPETDSLNTVLIVICCVIPCLLILLLLLKKREKTFSKKILKKPKHDYFEFNEDDI